MFLRDYCHDCHVGEEAESGIDFDVLRLEGRLDRVRWRKIIDRVLHQEMPPKDSEQPSVEERSAFVAEIEGRLHDAACGDGVLPGPALTRRLNRDEYGNTLRDLLGIHVNVALTLPDDGAGGEGFDNAAETLFLSPLHGEKYLEAAKAALDHALRDGRARERILPEPGKDQAAADAMRADLGPFLRRAFRRPVELRELDSYVKIFEQHFAETGAKDEAQRLALTAALVSPHFLFRVEHPNHEDQPQPLSDHELASRLSYFLWVSMPDDELLSLADEGRLREPDVLMKQVKRMLSGGEVGKQANKVHGFAKSFIEQWLGTRALGREFRPDPAIAPRYDSELAGGLKYEPVLFFEDILVNDLSILSLIDADFTYASKRVARHYQIKGEFREQPKRVELPEGSRRGGVLGMGAVLAISSHPHRTSPVLRGKWILETLLGTPPPPPPPDVPELPKSNHDQPTTLRARLEVHREDPTCASCHDRIDPLGFGLENFDVLGRWRYRQEGQRIDATGTLPDGTAFDGPEELKAALMARKDQFARHFTAKVMGFALGRGLTDEDYCSVDTIVDELKTRDYSAHALIQGVIGSPAFRLKAGRADSIPTPEQESRQP